MWINCGCRFYRIMAAIWGAMFLSSSRQRSNHAPQRLKLHLANALSTMYVDGIANSLTTVHLCGIVVDENDVAGLQPALSDAARDQKLLGRPTSGVRRA